MNENNILISIVGPCYNEASCIGANLLKAKKISSAHPIEFIFVDNGSKDGTNRILNKDVISKLPEKIKFIKIEHNQGYGYGIKKGLALAKGKYCGWTHGDGQADLNDILDAVQIIKSDSGVGIVKGIREERALSDHFFSKSLALIASFFFVSNLNELNAQPSIYLKFLIPDFAFLANDLNFDIDVYVYVKLRKVTERRFPVKFKDRKFGSSSWNTGLLSKTSFIFSVFRHLLKLRYRIFLDKWR